MRGGGQRNFARGGERKERGNGPHNDSQRYPQLLWIIPVVELFLLGMIVGACIAAGVLGLLAIIVITRSFAAISGGSAHTGASFSQPFPESPAAENAAPDGTGTPTSGAGGLGGAPGGAPPRAAQAPSGPSGSFTGSLDELTGTAGHEFHREKQPLTRCSFCERARTRILAIFAKSGGL